VSDEGSEGNETTGWGAPQQGPPPGPGGGQQQAPGEWGQPPPEGWQQQAPGGWNQPKGGAWGGPPPPGYYPTRQTESSAIVALVLAIASFVICPLFPAIAAVIVGGGAERKIRQSNGMLDGEGLAKAGRIIGWINIILVSVVVLLGLAAVLVAGTASTTSY
jgi:hypothetical protein